MKNVVGTLATNLRKPIIFGAGQRKEICIFTDFTYVTDSAIAQSQYNTCSTVLKTC